MSDELPTPSEVPVESGDLLAADDVLAHVVKCAEIEFQAHGDSWTREKAEMHFKDRQALARVRMLLIDLAENWSS